MFLSFSFPWFPKEKQYDETVSSEINVNSNFLSDGTTQIVCELKEKEANLSFIYLMYDEHIKFELAIMIIL